MFIKTRNIKVKQTPDTSENVPVVFSMSEENHMDMVSNRIPWCLPKCSKSGMWRSATSSNYINVPNSNVTLVLLQIYHRKHKHGAIPVGQTLRFQ